MFRSENGKALRQRGACLCCVTLYCYLLFAQFGKQILRMNRLG